MLFKKIERGEIALDFEPITEESVSRKNLIEVMGIYWKPTLKNTKSREPMPREPLNLEVPEPNDPDAIPIQRKRKQLEEEEVYGE